MTGKPKRTRRGPMPDAMRERAKVSARRAVTHYTAPEVEIAPDGIRSPYVSADEAHWWRLVSEAFGTRTTSVLEVFLRQVGGLVGTHWDEQAQAHLPNAADVSAALAIVAAMKPKTEAEAAQAAQAFALHLVTMKVGAGIAKNTRVDPRQANALANLVKSYTGVMNSLKAGRGSRSTKQTIVVKKQVNITNDNRSVTLPGGGVPAADRSDGPDSSTRAGGAAGRIIEGGTGSIEGIPALSGPKKALVRAMPCASDAE